MNQNTVILTGGGTGGHIIPLLALLPELKKYFSDVLFVGCGEPEQNLCAAENVNFRAVKSPRFVRKLALSNLKIPFELAAAVKSAEKLLAEFSPAVVLGKGGYASLPCMLAAAKLKIPVIAHESDMSVGLANKIAVKKGARLVTAFDIGAETVGLPLRKEIYGGNAEKMKGQIRGFDAQKETLLVLGGSSGSAAINSAVTQAKTDLLRQYNIIHITGKGKEEHPQKGYLPIAYTSDVADCFALCDVVVSRAGATAIAELSALNKRTVLVPLPKGNSRGDQEQNAEYAKRFGATILRQNQLTASTLISAMESARPFRNCVADGTVALSKLCADYINKRET